MPDSPTLQPARIPCIIIDDFETGEMHGWESYPYAQDIGYDPFTVTTREPTHRGSRFSLSQTHRAHDAVELAQGFTKEIDIWSTRDTRMRLALFLMADRRPTQVELSLGLFDGRRFFHRLPDPEVNRWLELDLPLHGFMAHSGPLGPGEHIQVVTIQASYASTSHLFGYTLCLDDFTLNGERPRRFVARNPACTTFPLCDYGVLHRHFFRGEPLDLTLIPEAPAAGAEKPPERCCEPTDDSGQRAIVSDQEAAVSGQVSADGTRRPQGPAVSARRLTGKTQQRSGSARTRAGGAIGEIACDVVDPSGTTVALGLRLAQRDRAWKLEDDYVMPRHAPAGQWTLALTGRTEDGTQMRWPLRFIVPERPLTPADHPRLFFSREELDQRLRKPSARERELVHAIVEQWPGATDADIDAIRETRDVLPQALTGHRFSRIYSVPPWHASINRLSHIIRTGSWRYLLAGDEQVGRVARKALLKLCSFERWNHPWQLERRNHTYYPMGYTIGAVSLGFDSLFPLLTQAERDRVHAALMEKGIVPFYRDLVVMNRMPGSVTNHLAVLVAHLAMAVTALYGEDPENPSLEPYFSGMLERMQRFIHRTYYPDGGYGEPVGYEQMASRDLVKALHVLELNFGIDLTSTTHIRDMYRYPLHATDGDGSMEDFGDVGMRSGWSWDGDAVLWLTHRMRNPWTAHLCRCCPDSASNPLGRWLWETPEVEGRSREELIPSHCFPVKGTMLMRSDWSDDAVRLTFKCGPNSNHYHVDQGAFFLHAHGELLLSEAGLEHDAKGFHAYYSNLYYPVYDTQAIAHNVLIVDGDPESQAPADYRKGVAALRTWPRIRNHFAGRHCDMAQGDLACVYKGKLEAYTRSFIFLKPDLIVLFDRVRSHQGHTFSWLFHAEDRDGEPAIHVAGQRIRIQQPNAFLDMEVVAPSLDDVVVRRGVRDESFAELTAAHDLRAADLLAVMVPGEGIAPEAPSMEARILHDVPGWIGTRIQRGEAVTRVFFPMEPAGVRAHGAAARSVVPDPEPCGSADSTCDVSACGERHDAPDMCSAQGACFALHSDGEGKPVSFFLRGRALDWDELSVSSTRPVSVWGSMGDAAGSYDVELEVDCAEATELAVRLPAGPRVGSPALGVRSSAGPGENGGIPTETDREPHPDSTLRHEPPGIPGMEGSTLEAWSYDAEDQLLHMRIRPGRALIVARW